MTTQTRTIVKYPNRRLYDTHASRYVTLDDVRCLVNQRVSFVVLDRKSQIDLTHEILMQLVAAGVRSTQAGLQRDFLAELIRLQGSPMQAALSRYLERCLELFISGFSERDAACGRFAQANGCKSDANHPPEPR